MYFSGTLLSIIKTCSLQLMDFVCFYYRKELASMFPGKNVENGSFTIITYRNNCVKRMYHSAF